MFNTETETKIKSYFASFLTNKRNIINIALVLIFIYIFISQFDKFHSSINIVQHVNLYWLLFGFLVSLLTFVLSALSYYVLAKKPLKFIGTVLNQVASMFANHLLPSGIGSLGVSYQYLRKNKHTKNEAIAIVYLNNILGFVGYLIIIAIIAVFTTTKLNLINLNKFNFLIVLGIAAILICLFLILFKYKKLRKSISESIIEIHKHIYLYRYNKLKLLLSTLSIMGLTMLYALSLYICGLAVGYHISIADALIILAIGVSAKAVTPTPGGIIGMEAGLFAGLLAYGTTSGEALIIILTYRLITYWLPFLFGAIAYYYVSSKQYI